MAAPLSNLYWMVLGAAFIGACSATLFAMTPRLDTRRGTAWLALALLALFLSGRWPSIFIPGLLNPDESMMLAQAMKLAVSPIPWRSIDTGTGGPVNSFALLPLHWLGVDYGFPLARMTAIGCLSISLVLTVVAMRRIAGLTAAAIAVLPAAGFYALVTVNEFIHYSSEIASLAMIALVAFLAARLPREPLSASIDNRGAAALGLGLFLVSMSKLQGAPLGVVLTFCILTLVSQSAGVFLRRALFAAAGGAAAMTLLVLILAVSGALHDFYMSYIRLPYTYLTAPLGPRAMFAWLHANDGLLTFVKAASWMTGAALLLIPFHWSFKRNVALLVLRAVSAVLIAGALYVTLSQPGREFAHYKNYFPLGASWTLLMLLPWRARVYAADDAVGGTRLRATLPAMILGLASVFVLVEQLASRLESDWLIAPQIPYGDVNKRHWLYRVLGAVAKPGERLGIWGWAAHVWVYSGLVPATRESSTEFAARNWGPEGYYRNRFLESLQANPPPLFVEAVGPGQFAFVDRAQNGLATLPGLLPFLHRNYTQLIDDDDIGLWMRNDVLAKCCQFPRESIRRSTLDSTSFWADGGNSEVAKKQDWIISDSRAEGDTAHVTFINVSEGMHTALVPFMVGPNADRAGLRIEYNGAATPDCDRRIRTAPALTMDVCQISLDGGGHLEMVDDDPQPGAWIAVGAPLMTRNATLPAP